MTFRKAYPKILLFFSQALAGLVLVLLTTFLFLSLDIQNMGQFILVLLRFWICFTAGTYIVGVIGFKLQNQPIEKNWQRLLWTGISAAIPLIALIVTWFILNPVQPEIFEESIMGTWQPILAYLSLPLAIIGFYLPGWLKKRS